MSAPTSAQPSDDAAARDFPPDFVWGAATAAYQIEGAVHDDGRTDSIWDTFARLPGAVLDGDTGDVACDHYHRWPDDVALMADLGLSAYRFSISWSRVVPEPGVINQAGLAFYSALVDGLLARGITPWVTLYHWDLPQWLEDRGGWAARESVEHFVQLTRAVHGALGDRVRHWLTLNEPWCAAFLGYCGGQHAPGRQEPQAAISATHHLLLAHGAAVRTLRTADPTATVGITLNFTVADPAQPGDPADQRAARLSEAMLGGLFLEPVLHGAYPAEVVRIWADAGLHLPLVDGDLESIAEPIDVLGVNYYHGDLISAVPPPAELALPAAAATTRETRDPAVGLVAHSVSRGLPRTGMGWEVQPDGLRRLLVTLHTEHTGPAGVALVVTENGSAYPDTVGAGGEVDDPERTAYLVTHLAAARDALAQGVDLRGYFVWSLLDNFEWAYGYRQRFGIVRVDFDTLARTPKGSAHAYAAVIGTGLVPHPGTVSR